VPVAPVPTPSPQPVPVAAGPAPGQSPAPIGPSPATGPTQNQGYQVAAQKMAGLALLVLEQAMPLAGASSELGKEIHKAIGGIAKHVPPGSVTPADVKNVIQQLLLKQEQFGAQMQRLKSQQAQAQQQPQAGAMPQMAKAA